MQFHGGRVRWMAVLCDQRLRARTGEGQRWSVDGRQSGDRGGHRWPMVIRSIQRTSILFLMADNGWTLILVHGFIPIRIYIYLYRFSYISIISLHLSRSMYLYPIPRVQLLVASADEGSTVPTTTVVGGHAAGPRHAIDIIFRWKNRIFQQFFSRTMCIVFNSKMYYII